LAKAKVNGIELDYQLHGSAGKPVVVLINGLLTDQNSWSKQIPILKEHFQILTYDCRGQGNSDKPDHVYTTELHAEDLKQLLDLLEIGRLHLVGLSNGGAVALQFASLYPEYVEKMMLISSYDRSDQILRAKLGSWIAAMEYGGPLLRFDVATPYVWGATFLEHHYEALLPFRQYGGSIPPEAAKNLIAGVIQHQVGEKIGRITAKTLVLVGEEDILTPPVYAKRIIAQIPNGELRMIPEAGHCFPLEDPDRFNQILREFFAIPIENENKGE